MAAPPVGPDGPASNGWPTACRTTTVDAGRMGNADDDAAGGGTAAAGSGVGGTAQVGPTTETTVAAGGSWAGRETATWAAASAAAPTAAAAVGEANRWRLVSAGGTSAPAVDCRARPVPPLAVGACAVSTVV